VSRIIGQEFTDALQEAHRMIPAPILARVAHAQYFCGSDPVSAGLEDETRFDLIPGETSRTWPHTLYGRHSTTVVAPRIVHPNPLWTVAMFVHELGHVLDEALDFEINLNPVTEYAMNNRREAFAESFMWWCFGQVWDHDAYALGFWERMSGQDIPAERH